MKNHDTEKFQENPDGCGSQMNNLVTTKSFFLRKALIFLWKHEKYSNPCKFIALIPNVRIIHEVMTPQSSIKAPLSLQSLPFWFNFERTGAYSSSLLSIFHFLLPKWNLECSLSSFSPRRMLSADKKPEFFVTTKTRRQQQWKSVRKISQQVWLKKYLLNDARSYSNIYQSFKLQDV